MSLGNDIAKVQAENILPELYSYGKVRNFQGEYKTFCPFRFQGQYEDSETGLYYNRFRYYDPDSGCYISQDPISISGGLNIYAYVHEPNTWIDVLGLAGCPPKGSNKRKKLNNKLKRIRNTKGNKTLKGTISTAEADSLGKKWVGDNYKVTTTKKGDEIWLSKDGERQYRRPTKKPNSPYTKTGKQANYERNNADGSHDNAHIDIND